jgi:hypothetical protein
MQSLASPLRGPRRGEDGSTQETQRRQKIDERIFNQLEILANPEATPKQLKKAADLLDSTGADRVEFKQLVMLQLHKLAPQQLDVLALNLQKVDPSRSARFYVKEAKLACGNVMREKMVADVPSLSQGEVPVLQTPARRAASREPRAQTPEPRTPEPRTPEPRTPEPRTLGPERRPVSATQSASSSSRPLDPMAAPLLVFADPRATPKSLKEAVLAMELASGNATIDQFEGQVFTLLRAYTPEQIAIVEANVISVVRRDRPLASPYAEAIGLAVSAAYKRPSDPDVRDFGRAALEVALRRLPPGEPASAQDFKAVTDLAARARTLEAQYGHDALMRRDKALMFPKLVEMFEPDRFTGVGFTDDQLEAFQADLMTLKADLALEYLENVLRGRGIIPPPPPEL